MVVKGSGHDQRAGNGKRVRTVPRRARRPARIRDRLLRGTERPQRPRVAGGGAAQV